MARQVSRSPNAVREKTQGEVCGSTTVDTCVGTYRTPTQGGCRHGDGAHVVDAVLLEGRSARDVARAHGISKTWIYELIARFRAGGYEALEARSKRPRSC